MNAISVSKSGVLPVLALAAGCQHLPTQLPYAVTEDCTVQRVAAVPPAHEDVVASAARVGDRSSAPLHFASAERLGRTLMLSAAGRADDVQPLPSRPVRDAASVPGGRVVVDDARQPTPAPGGDVRQPPTRGGGGFGFGFGIMLPTAAPAPQPSIADQLVESGPHFPAAFSMSCVPVHGFVRAGWPVVVDYRPARDANVVLEIHAPGRAAPHVFPLDSTPRRQLVQLDLPATLGETPQVALLLVRASKRDGSGAGGIQLYGLGAGPRAVGSVAIDQVNFRPGEIRVSRNQQASYSFFSRTDFNRTMVEILRVQRQGEEIKVSLARTRPLQLAVNRNMWVGKEQPLTWDGFDEQRRVSSGAHLLQVRAWLDAQNEHDWVAAWSLQMVRVAE